MASNRLAEHRHQWRRWAVGLATVATVGSGALVPIAAHALEPSADLSVSVTHTPSSVLSTQEVTFTITAHNDGPDQADDVVGGFAFDYPLQFVSADEGCDRSSSSNSVICALGDVASGSTASAEVVVKPYASGVFTVPVAVSSDTPDPDTADRQATDTVIAQKGPSQAERYLRGIFPIILDREIDNASLAYWTPRWQATYNIYPNNHEKVPNGIIRSSEYRRLRVRESYLRILGRAVDAPSLTYWVNKAASGWSFERIDRALLGSGEFRRKGDLEANIKATFQATLGRQPTAAELDMWLSELAPTDVISWADFVRHIQISTEGYDVIINRVYQDTLGHAPSPFGRYVWQVRLRNGYTPEGLWVQLLVSWDVLQDYPLTEDDYPVYDYSGQAEGLARALEAS